MNISIVFAQIREFKALVTRPMPCYVTKWRFSFASVFLSSCGRMLPCYRSLIIFICFPVAAQHDNTQNSQSPVFLFRFFYYADFGWLFMIAASQMLRGCLIKNSGKSRWKQRKCSVICGLGEFRMKTEPGRTDLEQKSPFSDTKMYKRASRGRKRR